VVEEVGALNDDALAGLDARNNQVPELGAMNVAQDTQWLTEQHPRSLQSGSVEGSLRFGCWCR
jgi:hypothetical protein